MQYVPFGKLGFDISRLGMGCMRLPTRKEGDEDVLDIDAGATLIRRAIDGGVNYIDTAYGYHEGQSELAVAKALKDGYRERVKLATKLPCWHVNCYEDMDRLLNEQLKKLEVDYVDFYLLHALNRSSFEKMQKLGYKKFFEKAVADGRIRYPSFSFHDDAKTFRDIVDDYPWTMAQIQLNYMDDETQATVNGMHYAAKKGINIVVMEPLRGGSLANPPDSVQETIDAHPSGRSAVEWAFRYLYNFPEVQVILSGMSNDEQVDDNLRIFANAETSAMDAAEVAFVKDLKQAYLSRVKVGCTGCRYCMPCPQGVRITDIFRRYDDASMYGREKGFHHFYNELRGKQEDATKCVKCGACETACPQNIQIIEMLETIEHEMPVL